RHPRGHRGRAAEGQAHVSSCEHEALAVAGFPPPQHSEPDPQDAEGDDDGPTGAAVDGGCRCHFFLVLMKPAMTAPTEAEATRKPVPTSAKRVCRSMKRTEIVVEADQGPAVPSSERARTRKW